MPRPAWKDVQAGLQNWDASVRDNFANLSARPAALLAIPNGTIASFPASQFTQCFASYEATPGIWKPIWSSGTQWLNLFDQSVVA